MTVTSSRCQHGCVLAVYADQAIPLLDKRSAVASFLRGENTFAPLNSNNFQLLASPIGVFDDDAIKAHFSSFLIFNNDENSNLSSFYFSFVFFFFFHNLFSNFFCSLTKRAPLQLLVTS